MISFDKQPAYVLHRRPYQEANSLVMFLTPEYGRVTAVARASSKMLGKNIAPFVPVLIGCSRRGELFNLRHFDPQGKALLVRPKAQMIGMYLNELITCLVPPNVPSRSLFEAYAGTFAGLVERDSYESTLRRFEVKLLEITGRGLQLEHDCVTHEPLLSDAWYRYQPGEGPLRSNGRQRDGLCRGGTLLALGRGLPMVMPMLCARPSRCCAKS